jgi:hypothetical protein
MQALSVPVRAFSVRASSALESKRNGLYRVRAS